MDLNSVHEWEQTVVKMLNFDGWDLEWVGGDFTSYDAKGKTKKGKECVIEIKFRNKYYKTKLLEKYKYNRLMQVKGDVHKLYLVFDPKGMYIFWLNKIDLPTSEQLSCPDTSLWTKEKKDKEVYLLEESQASYINNESGFNRKL